MSAVQSAEHPPALSTLTTMQVGGVPSGYVAPASTDELIDTVREVWAGADDWLLLAGGSNTVASDAEFEGTVIRVATRGIERLNRPDAVTGGSARDQRSVRLRVQAGESWDGLVETSVRNGWSGIEALSGIPGSVGAAPVQNIGAYGQELSSSLAAIDFLDFDSGDVRRIDAGELGLGYRTSALKRGMLGVVLAVELDLTDANDQVGAPHSEPVEYAQLADALGINPGARVSLAELRRSVLRLRASKGMVLDPSDQDSVSSGSFFTNPIVTENFARSLPADAPRWLTEPAEPDLVMPLGSDSGSRSGSGPGSGYGGSELPEAHVEAIEAVTDARRTAGTPSAMPYTVKLSAAWLIEQAGVRRGFALPGSRAAISSKHTLAITNRGGASADEIIQLATFVQSRVQSEFGVILQPEPVLVGLSL